MANITAIDPLFNNSNNVVISLALPMSFPSSSSPTSSINATPSAKKKRGRPPKADSLSNKITTTLNINVNTSPMCNSPTAENNSNLIVKRGAPDVFTPLMRVSPNSKRKRSKSSMSVESSGGQKKPKNDLMVTPLSGAINGSTFTPYHLINSQTLDNISMITQSNPRDSIHSDEYGSPLIRSLSMPYHQPDILSTPSIHNHKNVFPTPTSSGAKSIVNPSYMFFGNENYVPETIEKPNNDAKNLLPPVVITKEIVPVSKPLVNKNDFQLKLTIDDLGKAVLSNDFFQSNDKRTDEAKQSKPSNEQLFEQKFVESPIKEMDFARVDSTIGLETNHVPQKYKKSTISSNGSDGDKLVSHPGTLRRHHSDITGVSSNAFNSASTLMSINECTNDSLSEKTHSQLPQTPKQKDNYYISTGLTPSNLNFNLTPNFNSMMYSIMNINSPQQKKTTNNSQFLSNQEFFMNGVSGGHQPQSPQQPQLQNTVCMTNLMSNGSKPKRSLESALPPSSLTPSSASSASDDSGDARLALKKIIQIKKK